MKIYLQARRRNYRPAQAAWVRTVGTLIRLSAGGDDETSARFQRAGSGGIYGWLRRRGGVCRGTLHAGYGPELRALLSQRILREMRALSARLPEIGDHAHAMDPGQSRAWGSPNHGRLVSGNEHGFDLRAWPDRSCPNCLRAEALSRSG